MGQTTTMSHQQSGQLGTNSQSMTALSSRVVYKIGQCTNTSLTMSVSVSVSVVSTTASKDSLSATKTSKTASSLSVVTIRQVIGSPSSHQCGNALTATT